jgi:hypothetical protein
MMLALCRMPSLWEVLLSVMDVKIRFTVIITFKKYSIKLPVLKEMLKMLPSDQMHSGIVWCVECIPVTC